MSEGTYIGPSRAAAAGRARRPRWMTPQEGRQAAHRGARRPGAGQLFEPTVLFDVNHSMELMREESFGPIIGIQKVADDAEAVALMNDTRYGLTAGVYTPDEAQRARTAGAGQGRQRLLELL